VASDHGDAQEAGAAPDEVLTAFFDLGDFWVAIAFVA
jgi:hypothetical protein